MTEYHGMGRHNGIRRHAVDQDGSDGKDPGEATDTERYLYLDTYRRSISISVSIKDLRRIGSL
jgi:hypothetical protein